MEKVLFDEITAFFGKPEGQRDIEAGALALLKLNRNRTLYQYILRTKDEKKLSYELKKLYDISTSEMSINEVVLQETRVSGIIENVAFSETKIVGRRSDHDELPDEIKALYIENAELNKRARSVHERLKTMEQQEPCDRFPFVKELCTIDEKIRSNWTSYDVYKQGSPISKNEKPIVDAKRISANRKYISDNKNKLEKLKNSDLEKYESLKQKVQERIDELAICGESISDEQKKALSEFGLTV